MSVILAAGSTMLKNFILTNLYRLSLLAAVCQGHLQRALSRGKKSNIAFVVEEFFHKDLRGFGGFGMTVKNISDHYNTQNADIHIKVAFTEGLEDLKAPFIQKYHNADVLIGPKNEFTKKTTFPAYIHLLNQLNTKLFITIDYYPTYNYTLKAAPFVPVIVYIRDPRGKEEWEKLAGVDLELKQRKSETREKLVLLAEQKAAAIHEILEFSKKYNRKVIFATNGDFLIKRAERTYNLKNLKTHTLLNPIELPKITKITHSPRPSLCFLGRLDAQKRFWMIPELAKRFPQVDFYLCGETHASELMQPLIDSFPKLQNLHNMGLTVDSEKARILDFCWGLINTSIHEGLPVSFQEALSYGKPIISCIDAEDIVEKYGYYTGEVPGNGLDRNSLDRFAAKIEEFLSDPEKRRDKGTRGKEYIEKNHTYPNFHKQLLNILQAENIKI